MSKKGGLEEKEGLRESKFELDDLIIRLKYCIKQSNHPSLTIDSIADFMSVRRQTVFSWLNRWSEPGRSKWHLIAKWLHYNELVYSKARPKGTTT